MRFLTTGDAVDKHPNNTIIISPTEQMLSSCTGALMTSLLMTPFDVVKIRLQSQAKPSNFTKGHCFVYCNGLMDHLCSCVNGLTHSSEWYKRPSHFNGTFDAMIKISRNEGITSLWSGLPPTLVMALPATVVYFTCYEQLKQCLRYDSNVHTDRWKPLAAGATARVWAATLISPIELIRTKMQSTRFTYTQVWKSVVDSVRVDGILSLWRGLGPTLLRDVPFSALYWSNYEALKAYIIYTWPRSDPTLSFVESFMCGAASGSIAAVITLPFDVIKTRRQIELGETVLLGKKSETRSTWKIIHKIYSGEGFRALYTGLIPRLLKVAPSCAIMISSYESLKYFFIVRRKRLAEEGQLSVNVPKNTDMIQPLPLSKPGDLPPPYLLSGGRKPFEVAGTTQHETDRNS
ncbi:probable mitochondrial glutathione transporter SLC25A40 [Biomphalaria glabrata]|uniref:Probable mitochondrial glutathione transporter SLC25A40 n=1 Tax=Biomphalaria glabrata TaxID=6526 RepID=A0A9U8DUH9_BIOGL|nr:probable mitochondrial glutathione transporter SLC25A40 [Biomphalaria glabrata]XP_013061725.2 probable mitochondrial glutathione transporter SLC25A40 [Biomphalaria glabrata]